MGFVKIISASAGSGKTYTLAYRYIRDVIANPVLYKHILAVTFTNKATDEMKQRILASINELASDKDADGYRGRLHGDLGFDDSEITARARKVRSKILHDYSHFSVLTIDKFFQRIVRSFLKELGISVNFNLELANESLLGSAADRLLGDMATDEHIRSHVSAMVGERIDENKSWSIKREIESLGNQLFTESYKSRAGSLQNASELEAAFENLTEKAAQARKNIKQSAQKLADFMTGYGLEPEDFYQKAKGAGSYALKMALGSLEHYNSYVESAIGGKWTTGSSPKKTLIESLAPQLTAMLEELVVCYDDGIGIITTQALIKENYDKFMMLSDLQNKIDEISREENILHISEVNAMLSKLVTGNDVPFIFEKAGNQFSHFMIDEFQDTSAMQWNNFIPLLQNSVAQAEGQSVLLVGDVKQSIYRWRGGDWSILSDRAAGEFSESAKDRLQENHRSRAEVVRFMNAIIGQCVARDGEKIAVTLAEARAKGALSAELEADLAVMVGNAYSDYLQTVPKGKEGGYVTITSYTDSRDNNIETDVNENNNYIHPAIKMVEQLQTRGYRAGDIAILVRRNTEGNRMAQMLLEYKNSHPESPYCYDVITQEALVIGRSPIVNFVISCLRLSTDSSDSLSRAQYNRWQGREFDCPLSCGEEEFFVRLGLLSPEEAFEQIVINYGFSQQHGQTAYLQALHQQIISFTAKQIADTPLFLKWWEESGSRESVSLPTCVNAITIDTIHRSKGLGYKVVIIPYCNWSMTTKPSTVIWAQASADSPAAALGKFPVSYKKEMAASHFSQEYYREYVMSHIDNLNLLYVAVTRAKEELHIMIPQKEGQKAGRGSGNRETVDRLITASLVAEGSKVRLHSIEGGTGEILDDIEGTASETYSGTTYSFGQPVAGHITEFIAPNSAGSSAKVTEHSTASTADAACPATLSFAATSPKEQEQTFETGFTTNDISGRVRLKLSHQRYFDKERDALAPRDYGILMHKAFESAATMEDIRRNISQMEKNGAITECEASQLARSLEEAMGNEIVRSWFDGQWNEVRNEAGIIVPGSSGYRPDRTMTSGNRAIVIDYKFGRHERQKYVEQVSGYMSLLKSMGYSEISGYVWYITLGKVVDAGLGN